MRSTKRLLLLLLVIFCLSIELIPVAGFADREYVVRFYASNADIGTIDGQSVQIAHNDQVKTPDVNIVNNKYFFRGFRQSGRDPLSLEQAGGTITVTEDRDFVAAFGVRGNEVIYEVHYLLNGTTTEIASTREFYALVGDKPISAYIYIDGYQPYRRTTKTIIGDRSEDILYVYYTRIATGGGGGTTGGGGAVAGGGGAAAGGAAANAAANPANPANPAANPAANPNVPQGTNNNAPAPTQQYAEYEDIMDLDVPLAAPDMMGVGSAKVPNAPKVIESNQRGRLPNWALIAGMVVLVGLIAMLYWYLLFYRKKKKYASYDEDYEVLGFDDD